MCLFPLQIDPNISPEELLGHVTSDQPEPTRKYLLVGLHTCGDLAPTILRLFAKSDSVVGVVSVGCCYMKVTCLSCDQPPAPNIPTCECDMAATCVHTCATKDPQGELIVCRLVARAPVSRSDHCSVPLGYPMSGRITSLPSHSLSYEAREMACHALEAYAERLEGKFGIWGGSHDAVCDVWGLDFRTSLAPTCRALPLV